MFGLWYLTKFIIQIFRKVRQSVKGRFSRVLLITIFLGTCSFGFENELVLTKHVGSNCHSVGSVDKEIGIWMGPNGRIIWIHIGTVEDMFEMHEDTCNEQSKFYTLSSV